MELTRNMINGVRGKIISDEERQRISNSYTNTTDKNTTLIICSEEVIELIEMIVQYRKYGSTEDVILHLHEEYVDCLWVISTISHLTGMNIKSFNNKTIPLSSDNDLILRLCDINHYLSKYLRRKISDIDIMFQMAYLGQCLDYIALKYKLNQEDIIGIQYLKTMRTLKRLGK